MKFNSLRIGASIGVALLMGSFAASADPQDIQYVLTPVNDGIGDTLTGTITTDGTLGVLQGSDILSFQFTFDLSAGLTVDDRTPSIDVGTWGSSDPGVLVTNILIPSPTGVVASANALTSVGGGNLFITETAGNNHAYFSINNSFLTFGDQHFSEQTGLTVNPVFATTAPEIDPSSATSGLTLLLGGLLVFRGRRPQRAMA
jgi:hypothetical protein